MNRKLSVLTSTLLCTACSLVEPIPGASEVILSNDQTSCQKLQEIEVEALDTVLFMDRDLPIIADELQTLAQNEALSLGGNAIWPESGIADGKQKFSVLRCSRRD